MTERLEQTVSRAAFDELNDELIPLIPVTASDLQDEKRKNIIANVTRECHAKTMFTLCYNSYTRTQVVPSFKNLQSIGLELLTPTQPAVSMTAQPVVTFVNFFSFVSTCFGTWLSLAFLPSVGRLLILLNQRRSRKIAAKRAQSGRSDVRENFYPCYRHELFY